MPRAFLITHRRYNGAVEEFEESGRGYSPERGVRLAEYSNGHPTSDGASECGSETSSECPEELYNLTKLAEVSLAAAAGTLIHPSNVIYERPNSPKSTHLPDKCASRVVISRTKSLQQQQQSQQDREESEYQATFLQEERTRDNRGKLSFERIESERDNVDSRTEATVLQVRLSSQSQHLHSRYPRHQRDDAQLRVPPEDNFVNDPVSEASPSGLTAPSNSTAFSANIPQTRKISSINGESGKSEDNEDHECPDCGKKYSTSSNLARHRQTHRSLGDKKARRCPHCDKVYVSMPAFSMHVRTHNQGCKCHYCGKCFSRPWLLQGHIRTHTGEKPFKCTICNKAFADKSNLRAHIQTHSNTKPHVCGRCGKAFALKSYLYKHEESACMRAHHRSPAEKNETSEFSKTAPGPAPVVVASSTSRTSEAAVSPSSLSRLQATPTPCITASPTSVIVPRLDLNREQQRSSTSAFSAIIRHTRTSELSSSSTNSNKRVYRDKSTFVESSSGKGTDTVSADNPSKMAIRTSVISPNPEHLGRFGNDSKKSSNSYDYPDSVRVSAFSRPMAMTLNLAIA